MVNKCPNSAEIIRPILRGRDIARYHANFADLYLINTHNGIPLKNIPPIDIKQYPAIKSHLDGYWKKIKDRDDQGFTPYNLRSCAYMEEFSKQKIVWNRIASEKIFAFVDEGIFIQDSMHFFTGNHLKYLCGVLNSKLFIWLMKLIVGEAAGGNAGNSDNVRNLVIPVPKKKQEQQIELYLKKTEYKEIDLFIYSLYELSDYEIKFIESQ